MNVSVEGETFIRFMMSKSGMNVFFGPFEASKTCEKARVSRRTCLYDPTRARTGQGEGTLPRGR